METSELNREQLESFRTSFQSGTRSVEAFLKSEEFTEVVPAGLTTTSDSSSIPLVVSMVTVTGTILLALLAV